ncbi:MAG: hypothetical protein ACM30I_06570 [Gemmatimonas sp.]
MVEICRYADDPGRFLDLLGGSACPFADAVSFPLSARYYRAYFAGDYRGDLSFVAHEGAVVRAVVRAQAVATTVFDNGQGASVWLAGVAAHDVIAALDQAARALGCHTVKVSDPAHEGRLGDLGRHLLYRRAALRSRFIAVADLDRGDDALRAGLRKSFRSLVNWGTRTLKLQRITAETFDAQAFESFRQFHIKISGRETRSAESWSIQAEMIRARRAELLLSYLDGHGLVGGSLLLDTGAITTYGVGVYERELFDKPLSHAPLFMAMQHARERGQRVFVLGDVPPAGTVTDKEFSIGQFKAGFTDTTLAALDWTYELSAAPDHG